MLDSESAGSCVARSLLNPASMANTAAATSGAGLWADTQDLDGYLMVAQVTGAVTGSVTGKLQAADDANGTGAVDIVGAAFAAVSTANAAGQVLVIPKTAMTKRYLGYAGVVVTGPVFVGATLLGSKKYS